MKKTLGWIVLATLTLLTVFDGLLLALGQFGHDFNNGGSNPPSLQYGWLFFVLKVAALALSRRSSLPLLVIGVADWTYGVAIFQMHIRHLPFTSASGEGWMETSFLLLAAIYVVAMSHGKLNNQAGGRSRF
jgi:hypothetical protein